MALLPQPQESPAAGCFDFYGLAIEVRSTSATLVEEVRRDFAYFHASPGREPVRIQVHFVPPPYEGLPVIPAAFFTPRNVCFRAEHVTYIDYFGRGLAVFDRREKRCAVYGTDEDLVHEIVYLFILSTVGQYLDSRGIHRVHALGVSYRQQGVLLLLPSGGGKSTMALSLLREPEFMLLSEDTPLIDRRGMMLPFPLRLGVRPEQQPDIPAQYLRTVRRMEFDPKTLIDLEYFQDRVGQPVMPRFLLVGERSLGEVAQLVPLAPRHALKAVIKDMVVGLGIYQGLEFLLERGAWELLGQGGVAASRLYNGLRLLARASAYRFVLGRNLEKNRQTLLEFLHDKCA
jgi:hypothetical protein